MQCPRSQWTRNITNRYFFLYILPSLGTATPFGGGSFFYMAKLKAVVSVSDSNVPQIEEFLKVQHNKENQQITSARALWEWLGVETKFADWFARRVEEYGFTEGSDFVEVFPKNEKNSKGGRPSTDFAIKLGMAKELSMAERTEKGKATRKYFLKCEEKAKEGIQQALPTTYLEALEALVKSEKEKQQMAIQNKEQKNRLTNWLLPTEIFHNLKGDFPLLKVSAQMHTKSWSISKVIKTLGWLDDNGFAIEPFKDKYICDFSDEKTDHASPRALAVGKVVG